MLCERTCALLNSLSGISDTCILRYPLTIINDDCKSVIARLDLSEFEDEFEPIGLNDKISNLTSIISMFNEPEITRVDNILCIKDSDQKIDTQFVTDSVDLLANTEFKSDVFDRIVNSLTVAEFNLDKEDIVRLKKAHSVYNDLDDVILESTEDGIKISLGALSKYSRSENKFSLVKDTEGEVKKEFTCAVAFDLLQRIPQVSYNVQVKFSERTNTYALVLTNTDLKVQIILSVLVR